MVVLSGSIGQYRITGSIPASPLPATIPPADTTAATTAKDVTAAPTTVQATPAPVPMTSSPATTTETEATTAALKTTVPEQVPSELRFHASGKKKLNLELDVASATSSPFVITACLQRKNKKEDSLKLHIQQRDLIKKKWVTLEKKTVPDGDDAATCASYTTDDHVSLTDARFRFKVRSKKNTKFTLHYDSYSMDEAPCTNTESGL